MKKIPTPAAPRSPRVERLITQLVRRNLDLGVPVRSNENCGTWCGGMCAFRP